MSFPGERNRLDRIFIFFCESKKVGSDEFPIEICSPFFGGEEFDPSFWTMGGGSEPAFFLLEIQGAARGVITLLIIESL